MTGLLTGFQPMKVLKIERFIPLFFIVALLAACSSADGQQTGTDTPLATTQPVPASPTPRMSATEAASTSPAVPPPGNENVSNGQLYFVGFVDQRPKIIRLDLQSGDETILFDPPESAWLSEVAVSPDGSQLLLAYSPPPEGSQIQYGFTGLYTMPADGSAEPQSLVQRADPSESYFNISWPLDEYLYYAHFTPTSGR